MSPLLSLIRCSSFIFLPPSKLDPLWSCETPPLTWHRWTSCLAAPHYSLSNDLNADRADVCLYSMPLRWPPVQRRSGRAPGRKRKLILASRNDLLCSRFGLAGRQHAISRSSALSLPGCSLPPAATPAHWLLSTQPTQPFPVPTFFLHSMVNLSSNHLSLCAFWS